MVKPALPPRTNPAFSKFTMCLETLLAEAPIRAPGWAHHHPFARRDLVQNLPMRQVRHRRKRLDGIPEVFLFEWAGAGELW